MSKGTDYWGAIPKKRTRLQRERDKYITQGDIVMHIYIYGQ